MRHGVAVRWTWFVFFVIGGRRSCIQHASGFDPLAPRFTAVSNARVPPSFRMSVPTHVGCPSFTAWLRSSRRNVALDTMHARVSTLETILHARKHRIIGPVGRSGRERQGRRSRARAGYVSLAVGVTAQRLDLYVTSALEGLSSVRLLAHRRCRCYICGRSPGYFRGETKQSPSSGRPFPMIVPRPGCSPYIGPEGTVDAAPHHRRGRPSRSRHGVSSCVAPPACVSAMSLLMSPSYVRSRSCPLEELSV